MKKHLKTKVAGSRMRWAGHVQRMGEDRLSKREWKAEEGGRRKRGRPKLQWKDCIKRDLERPRVEDHRRREREMERVNNESGRNYQVTWTPPRKGARARRRILNRIRLPIHICSISNINVFFCIRRQVPAGTTWCMCTVDNS